MPYYLDDAIIFHPTLNPKLWDSNGAMHPEILQGLLAMAEEFKDFLGLDDLDIKDITVSGSNAAYTYTPHSDIDLHLVVDIPGDQENLYRELFDAKKNLYNLVHDQKVKGFDVEFYVQNDADPVKSMGIFSVLRNKWISFPKKVKATIDDLSVKSKVESFGNKIREAINGDDYQLAKKTWDELKNMRRSGLERGGEFSPENLAFKILRTQGYQDQLYDKIVELKDRELSVESVTEDSTHQGIVYRQLAGDDFYTDFVDRDETARARLKYLSSGWRDITSEIDLTAIKNKKAIGVAGIRHSPEEKNVIWMTFLSVDPEFRGQGVAKKLAEMVFEYAKAHNQRIRLSSYSEMGEAYLRKVFDHLKTQYPEIAVKDGDDHYKFDLDEK